MKVERNLKSVSEHYRAKMMKNFDEYCDEETYNVKGMKKKFNALFNKLDKAIVENDYDAINEVSEEINSQWDGHFDGDNTFWAENNAIEALVFMLDIPSPENGGTPETIKYMEKELDEVFAEMNGESD